jgi:hypothetical protein
MAVVETFHKKQQRERHRHLGTACCRSRITAHSRFKYKILQDRLAAAPNVKFLQVEQADDNLHGVGVALGTKECCAATLAVVCSGWGRGIGWAGENRLSGFSNNYALRALSTRVK